MFCRGLLRGDAMNCQIISVAKRMMGFLLCICLAGLFVLLMTWLILELRDENPAAQRILFGSAYSTAVRPSMDERSDSWETRARVDKAWRDEYLQNDMSLKSEFDMYGEEQDPQLVHVADARDYAIQK